jgi:hypothetical protein
MWARLQSPADPIGFDAEPLSGGRRANAGAPDDGSGLDPRGADRHAGGVAARHHGVHEDIDRGRTAHPAHDLAFEGAADLAGGAPLSLVVLGNALGNTVATDLSQGHRDNPDRWASRHADEAAVA